MTREQFTTLIATIETGGKNTAAEMRNVLNAFKDGIALTGDIKAIHCDAAYIALNFTNDGLGRLEREGWAMCNGLNGTMPIQERTLVGYGGAYTTPGYPFGSPNSVVVSHKHKSVEDSNGINVGNAAGTGVTTNVYNIAGSYLTSKIDETSITGESGAGKNYQPSIIVVYIQKL